jgi:hypothetical protein
LGILEVQGGNQCLVVGWDWLPVFPEALDIAGYGVLYHFSGFGQGATVSDAAGQRGHQGGESNLGFRPENNIEMVVRFLHGTSLLYLNSRVLVKYRAAGLKTA